MKKALALLLGILLGCALTIEYHRLYPSLQGEGQNQEMLRILFVGDIMPSRYVARTMESKGYDFPFEKMAATIQNADIAFANLESPILAGRKVQAGEMRFRADPQFVPSLSKAGFDIVTLANNHMYDFGEKGITQTLATLSANNIEHIGAGSFDDAYRPKYVEKKGVRVAFIGQNDRTPVPEHTCATEAHLGTACFDQQKLKAAITQARTHADFIVFTMHAGTEYTSVPNSLQKTYARAAIDAGADLVIGHHPHVIQERDDAIASRIFLPEDARKKCSRSEEAAR
jgi:poly-gamma-glutamate synthesis protein (capsule biosynthesis protein)